ncbi:MAG: DUF2079 domain-containing protein [Dehalococcoidales bacterium]|nr:DUF2079 domain-containing protein [Dehalococcoidales bacterium]
MNRILKLIRAPYFAVVVIALVYIGITIYISIHLLHDSYNTHAFDLGIFAQSLKFTLAGQFLYNTPEGLCHLAYHFSPILLLLTPFYWLFPHVQTLLVCQAILFGISGVIVYKLCRVNNLSHRTGLLIEFLFFINPLLWGTAMFDFHASAFAVPAILTLLLGIQTNKRWLIITGLVVALTTKEDVIILMGIFGAGMLLYTLWRERKLSRLYLTIFIASLAAYGVAVGVSAIASEGNFPRILTYSTVRYEYMQLPAGETFQGALATLFNAGTLSLLFAYLTPLGYFPLFQLRWTFPALVVFLENALSTCPAQHALHQSHAAALPFLFMGLIGGLVWIKGQPKIQSVISKAGHRTITYVFIFIIILTSLQYVSNSRVKYAKLPGPEEAATNQVLALIPDCATVTTMNKVFPHICDRTTAYLPWFKDPYTPIENGDWGFPTKDTEYVVVDRAHDGAQGTMEFIIKKQPDKYELIMELDGVKLYRLKQP